MKQQLLNLILIFSLTILTFQTAHASLKDVDVSDVQAEIMQTVQNVLHSLDEPTPMSPVIESQDDHDWSFKRFLLRLQLKMGIEVPIFAKFEVVPEIELVFLKEDK